MMVISLVVGQVITKTGKYKIFPIIGGVGHGRRHVPAVPAGRRHHQGQTRRVYMAVLGLGMGFLMQTTMLIAQNSVEQKDLGVASSAATFFRSIGGSFGVVAVRRDLHPPAADDLRRRQVGAGRRDQLTGGGGGGAGRPARRCGAAAGTGAEPRCCTASPTRRRSVFLWAIPFAVLVAGARRVFIKEVPLRGARRDAEATRAGGERRCVSRME